MLYATTQVLLAASAAHSLSANCHNKLERLWSPDGARAAAMSVIETRESKETISKYDIKVESDSRDAGKWLVWQSLKESVVHPTGGGIMVTAGGGGLSMRIDKCTGRISDVFWQR